MTSLFHPTGSSAGRARFLVFALLLVVLAFVLAPAARAGHDDFEFGKKLAQAQLFGYARKVYQQILADPGTTDAQKGEAKYGLALLKNDEAIALASRANTTFAQIRGRFDEAARDIEDFVEKNPTNENATQAKLDVGKIRLAFVQWVRELIADPDRLARRGFDLNELREAATENVEKATAYFKALRPDPNDPDPKPYQILADYYYVNTQYYAALVLEPCSSAARRALERATKLLDDYTMDHEGELLGVYAYDLYGLVWWERAKCEEDEDKRYDYFRSAIEWFVTCVNTENLGKEYLRVITRGYYHLAQAARDAGTIKGRNFPREARKYLEKMLRTHPTAGRTDSGIRALIAWSKLECDRNNTRRAIEIPRDASARAKKEGFVFLKRLANRQITEYVAGGCGGTVGGLKADVLVSVADDLFVNRRLEDALRAYQSVITATPPTSKGFVDFAWHAWERMAQVYRALDDRLGEALALGAIHEAWKNGLIPHEDKEGDPNLIRAGNDRRLAERAFNAVAEATSSPVFEAAYKKIRKDFIKDYPKHPSVGASVWNAGLGKFKEAIAMMEKKDPRWKA
ncbi:MAG: hypothetical protein ACC662_04710, partial [Planctomycetota bacterium]